MNISKEHFDTWMERILERMELLEKRMDKLHNSHNFFEGERLFDNQELCFLLHVSKRSLQRYRSSGKIKFYRITQKIYYKESDVYNFIKAEFKQNKYK